MTDVCEVAEEIVFQLQLTLLNVICDT